jgi:hypothetical protein
LGWCAAKKNVTKGREFGSQSKYANQKYKCKEFAEDLRNQLKAEGIQGETVILKGGGKYGIDSLKHGNIAKNNYHEAIKVGDTVFDNMNPSGMKYDDWLYDVGYGQGFPGYDFAPINPVPF